MGWAMGKSWRKETMKYEITIDKLTIILNLWKISYNLKKKENDKISIGSIKNIFVGMGR